MEKKIKATIKFLKELGFEELYSTKEVPNFETEIELSPEKKISYRTNKVQEEVQNLPSEVPSEKERLLRELYERNKDCCSCDLCKSRTQIVFYDGDPNSSVMFVGEAPGEDEDRLGKPFVGRAGKYLNKVLEKIGWSRESIYITNVCKCHPPGNRKPLPKEMQTCSNVFLKHEIKIVKPKVICCLGATAAEAFLGKSVRITRMRGQFYPNPLFPEAKLFLTYHPAYILRNMREAKTFEEDLKKVKEYVETLSV
jgi:uracil-DNA glycosylase family 4